MIGDIPELGSSLALTRHPLKWTEGHIWVSEIPVVTRQPMFRYNYIMIDAKSGKQVDQNERGVKRIADLASIGSHGDTSVNLRHGFDTDGYVVNREGNVRHIEIYDIWNTLKIKFTVLHPRITHHQSIRLTGNLPELGNWNKVDPIMLHPEEINSGSTEALVTYSVTVAIQNAQDSTSFGFNYSYSLWNSVTREVEWERDPSRKMSVLRSEEYTGQLG